MLTMQGIKGGDPEVACQAIEFWSTICDEEFEILYDEGDESPRFVCLFASFVFSLLKLKKKKDI